MAKKRRQAKIPTLAWERPRGTIGSRVLGRGFQFYGAVAIAVLMVLGLGVVGYAFYDDWDEGRKRPGSTAIQVEDTRFNLQYFSDRLEMFVDQLGGQSSDAAQPANALPSVAGLIIQEEIVRRFAGELDVTATEEEIREGIASRLGITVDDETFDVVFEQELARSGLSELDYRLMVEAAVLTDKLRQHFQGEVPESAESARYRQIVVSEQGTADELLAEIESGGDFAALAAKNSLDAQTKDNGGDVGWVPRGSLDASTEELVFALGPGEVSTIPAPQGVFVIEMLEKEEDRAIEEEAKVPLATRAFSSWVQEKGQTLTIVNNVDLSEGDSDKIEWAVSRAYQS